MTQHAENGLKATVYTAASPLGRPLPVVRSMLSDLVAARGVAWYLFLRDVKAQHRQSLLGYLWMILPPLAASLPFIYLQSQGIVSVHDIPVPYAVYAIIGTVIWQSFVDAINAPLRAVSSAKPVIARVRVPCEALLLSALGHVAFATAVRLLLLAALLACCSFEPAATAWLFPLGLLAVIAAGFAVGLVLTPAGLLYGDIQNGLPIATSLLLLLTPVLYPAPRGGIGAAVSAVNPMAPLVSTTRDWLVSGHSETTAAFFAVAAIGLVVALLGWVALRVALPHIVARIGN